MIGRLFKFHGGIKPNAHKNESAGPAIQRAPLPARLVVPLRQAGLAISGRRAAMLAANIAAVHGARTTLGGYTVYNADNAGTATNAAKAGRKTGPLAERSTKPPPDEKPIRLRRILGLARPVACTKSTRSSSSCWW